ncbi:MAG: beta-galactosidase [bacterium]|nr:beta-galactosidase [bacterium]
MRAWFRILGLGVMLMAIGGTTSPRAGELPLAQVKPHNGRPTLFINGQPHNDFCTMTYHPGLSEFKELAGIGIDLFSFSVTSDYSYYNLASPVWKGPGEYDYSQIEERAKLVLEANPNAWILLRVYVSAPPWWMDQHPGDVCTFEGGATEMKDQRVRAANKRVPSMASETWRAATCDNLRRLIDHVQAQSWGSRVIGYHIASGITEEWMHWGCQSRQLADYSQAGVAGYRAWLKARYGSDGALREAWGDPAATLDAAAVPTPEERRAPGPTIFLDPATNRKVIDYNYFLSDLVVDTLSLFTRTVKEKTNNTKLVGIFYGYIIELSWEKFSISQSGHLDIDRVFSLPSIDFISSPSSYTDRRPGEGYSFFMSLSDSLRYHGKLWMDENDYYTFKTRGALGTFGKMPSLAGTLAQQWREVGNVLAHGAGMWWFDMGGGWYSDPALLAEMKRMHAEGGHPLDLPYEPAAQVAVVIDPRTPHYLRYEDTYHSIAHRFAKREWLRMGAPIEMLSLADYAAGVGGPYKMVIFTNLVKATPAERDALRARLSRDRALALWQYASGYLGEKGYDPAGIRALTGFDVKLLPEKAPEKAALRLTARAIGKVPLPGDLSFAMPLTLDPLFTVSPGNGTEILGEYTAATAATVAAGGGVPSLAIKQEAGWTSVYSALPVLSAELLRALAATAGVHLYTPAPETLYASHNWVCINAIDDGKHTIRLPGRARVKSVYPPGLVDTEATSEIEFPLAAGETALFFVTPEETPSSGGR